MNSFIGRDIKKKVERNFIQRNFARNIRTRWHLLNWPHQKKKKIYNHVVTHHRECQQGHQFNYNLSLILDRLWRCDIISYAFTKISTFLSKATADRSISIPLFASQSKRKPFCDKMQATFSESNVKYLIYHTLCFYGSSVILLRCAHTHTNTSPLSVCVFLSKSLHTFLYRKIKHSFFLCTAQLLFGAILWVLNSGYTNVWIHFVHARVHSHTND